MDTVVKESLFIDESVMITYLRMQGERTHWTKPLVDPTSLSTTSNHTVCHFPVAKVKLPLESDVPKSELQMTFACSQKLAWLVGTYAYTGREDE